MSLQLSMWMRVCEKLKRSWGWFSAPRLPWHTPALYRRQLRQDTGRVCVCVCPAISESLLSAHPNRWATLTHCCWHTLSITSFQTERAWDQGQPQNKSVKRPMWCNCGETLHNLASSFSHYHSTSSTPLISPYLSKWFGHTSDGV